MKQKATVVALLFWSLWMPTTGFVVSSSLTTALLHSTQPIAANFFLGETFVAQNYFPSHVLSIETLDPTTFLSDLFAGVLGTPLLLAIPIVAALGVATLIAFLIVSYANPAEPDD